MGWIRGLIHYGKRLLRWLEAPATEKVVTDARSVFGLRSANPWLTDLRMRTVAERSVLGLLTLAQMSRLGLFSGEDMRHEISALVSPIAKRL